MMSPGLYFNQEILILFVFLCYRPQKIKNCYFLKMLLQLHEAIFWFIQIQTWFTSCQTVSDQSSPFKSEYNFSSPACITFTFAYFCFVVHTKTGTFAVVIASARSYLLIQLPQQSLTVSFLLSTGCKLIIKLLSYKNCPLYFLAAVHFYWCNQINDSLISYTSTQRCGNKSWQ